MSTCVTCANVAEEIKTKIALAFEEDFVDEVDFMEWTSTDRSQLEQKTLPVEEFVDLIIGYLIKLKKHFYINQEQQAAIRRKKEELQEGEVMS